MALSFTVCLVEGSYLWLLSRVREGDSVGFPLSSEVCSLLAGRGRLPTPGCFPLFFFLFRFEFCFLNRRKHLAMQPPTPRAGCWCSGGCWLTRQEASLGNASRKYIMCIIYGDININDQPSLTPCKNNQQQNCSCSCVEVSFLHRQQQGFPSRFPLAPAWVPSSSLSASPGDESSF